MTANTNLSLFPAASMAILLPSGENWTLPICEFLKKLPMGRRSVSD
jgi:hypothetical protein